MRTYKKYIHTSEWRSKGVRKEPCSSLVLILVSSDAMLTGSVGHTHIHTRKHAHTHTRTHTPAHTHARADTHTHTHTHVPSSAHEKKMLVRACINGCCGYLKVPQGVQGISRYLKVFKVSQGISRCSRCSRFLKGSRDI